MEDDEDDMLVFPLEEAARNIPLLFERLGIDSDRLYLKTLDEYIRDAPEMCKSQIQLTGDASHLSTRVCNLVMEVTIDTPHRDVQIDRIFLRLSNDGFQNNSRKFRGVYVTFGGTLNAKLTIYKGAKRIDCKGSNDMLTIYVSLEKVFALMRARLHNDLHTALVIKQHSLLNIVASCTFDFGLPLETLLSLYKSDCRRMRNDLRGQTKTSSAQFQGAIYERYIREEKRRGKLIQVHAKLLFQDGLPSVTCAGCNNYDDIREAFSHFYSIARLALGNTYSAAAANHGPVPAVFPLHEAVVPYTKKGKRRMQETHEYDDDEERMLIQAHEDYIRLPALEEEQANPKKRKISGSSSSIGSSNTKASAAKRHKPAGGEKDD